MPAICGFFYGVRKMPLPNILEFIGTNITQRKFQQAQEKLLNYLGVEVPTKADLSNVSADLNAKITPKADKTYVDNALSGFTNGASKFYPTLALAEADIANITVKDKVDIGEFANGGAWYKATTGATSLTKSAYDPLTQAKAYADFSIHGASYNIYEVPMSPSFSNATGVAGTKLFLDASPIDGVIKTVVARLAPTVTSMIVKIFELINSEYIAQSWSSVTINVAGTQHNLDSPLIIKEGQFVGFYTAGGAPLAFAAAVNEPYLTIANTDAVKLLPSNQSTANTWQIYFPVYSLDSVYGGIKKNSVDIASQASEIEVIKHFLEPNELIVGAPSVVGGNTAGLSKEYVPFAKPMDFSGTITSVEFNLLANDNVGFFVARPVDATTFRVVSETPYVPYTAGINTVNLGGVRCQKGDLLGFKAVGKNIISDRDSPAVDGGYYAVNKSGDLLILEGQYSLSQPRVQFKIVPDAALKILVLTQAEYDDLSVKDPNTLYGVI